MAHYASNLDSSPAIAPAIAPPTFGASSRQQASSSSLALPEMRSISPLPPTAEPAVIDLTSETQSVASSASRGTYSFPTTGATTNTDPFRQAAPELARPVAGTIDRAQAAQTKDVSEGELQRPAWANEGLGSDELSTMPVGTGTPNASRPETPLPPGAAPPARAMEPKRSGTE
jgi:hypothetical protein